MNTLLTDPRLTGCRRLYLRNWTVQANIGVYPAERESAQPIVLNIDVFVSLATSTPLSDDLHEIFDYDRIRQAVRDRLGRGHVNLQETLLDDLAGTLLALDGVRAVRLSSEKTSIYPDVAGIGVEILRFRETSA